MNIKDSFTNKCLKSFYTIYTNFAFYPSNKVAFIKINFKLQVLDD